MSQTCRNKIIKEDNLKESYVMKKDDNNAAPEIEKADFDIQTVRAKISYCLTDRDAAGLFARRPSRRKNGNTVQ
jgi:hypothetical protein